MRLGSFVRAWGKLDRNHVKYSRNAGENHIKLTAKVMSITTIPEAKKKLGRMIKCLICSNLLLMLNQLKPLPFN